MKLKLSILPIILLAVAGALMAAQKSEKPKTAKQPRINLVFCVDTTGSMGDEIEVVKDRMRDMIAKIAAGKPTPKVRVGVVAYRDRGDEYVTKKFELTEDLDAAVKTVSELRAFGGGDEEESVNEALHVAVSEMNWDKTPGITRLIYLIGDAGPKKYEQDFDPDTERKKALAERIVINAIGCRGLAPSGAEFFKKIAQGSEGTFANLTYREEHVKADGERMVVLREGSDMYAYSPSASEPGEAADWRGGAKEAAKAGAASTVTAADMVVVARPAKTELGGGYGGYARTRDGWQINAHMMNNLDTVMTRQAQELAARQQGIVYAKSDTVPFLRELQGPRTGVSKQVMRVIKDEQSWKAFWNAHQSGQMKAEPLPKVDFKNEMVLVAAVPRASGGIELREAAETDGRLVVTYALLPADKTGASPYHFAVVKKTAQPVAWAKGS